MAMTKKDFVAIAKIISNKVDANPTTDPTKLVPERVVLREVANDIADYCAKSNPEFKRGRFLEACGVV